MGQMQLQNVFECKRSNLYQVGIRSWNQPVLRKEGKVCFAHRKTRIFDEVRTQDGLTFTDYNPDAITAAPCL